MAPIFSPSFLFIIIQLVIATTLSILFTIASATSFTLPLIPPLSPESPFYQENLTQHQQLNHLISQTDYYLNSQSSKTSSNKFHLPVFNIPPSVFVTKLALGTPAKTQVLIIDTGSGTTWTQCKQCFDQTPVPLFNPNHSSSYHTVPCGPACMPHPYECVVGECKYMISYADESSSNGPVARETFTFGDRRVEMVFGCGDDNRDIIFAGKGISGVVGLSTSRYSLVNQLLGPHHRRFSYCLATGLNRSGLLKIGEDAKIRGSGVNTISFVRQEISTHYHLNLIDISVGSKRMRFPRGMFELREDGNGGCIIDSGTAATQLEEVPYNKVTTEFDQYFKSQGLRRLSFTAFEYCYGYDHRHFKKFIKMTFHFDRWVDYVVETPNMYRMVPEHGYFCVVLQKAKRRNVIGAWQQVNKRIVYDLVHKKLHFKQEDCARDAHYSESLIM